MFSPHHFEGIFGKGRGDVFSFAFRSVFSVSVFLANQIWHDEIDENVSRKLIGLNRALAGVFISYKLDLPPHFLLGHPLGTILGNATYGDCLVVY